MKTTILILVLSGLFFISNAQFIRDQSNIIINGKYSGTYDRRTGDVHIKIPQPVDPNIYRVGLVEGWDKAKHRKIWWIYWDGKLTGYYTLESIRTKYGWKSYYQWHSIN